MACRAGLAACRMPLPLSALVVLLLRSNAASAASCSSVEFLSAEDRRVASEAKSKSLDYCSSGMGSLKSRVDPTEGHDELVKGVGGDNRVYSILKSSASPDELSKQMEEQVLDDYGWLVSKASAIVLAFVVALVWLFCCWTAFPFCKCCRCCVKERYTHASTKLLVLIVAILAGIGILVGCILSVRGASKCLDGFDNFSCTSATLLDNSLSGHGGTRWVGMLPMLDIFKGLDTILDSNSGFMQQVDKALNDTYEIDVAVTEAMETVKLMRDTLKLNANMRPDPLFDCKLCETVQQPLGEVIGNLEDSLAKSLSDARAEVRGQLDSTTRAQLQCDLRSSSQPLVDVKDTIRDTLEFFIKDDGFGEIRKFVSRGDSPLVLLTVVFACILCAVLLSFACCATCCFLCKERFRERDDMIPYNHWVYRFACCTWCCGFGYAFVIFLIGGVLVASSVPMSGLCLVMEDIDSTKVSEISPALGLDLNPGTDDYEMAMGIIDQCFAPASYNGTGNLMDIIYVRENNTKVSMRDKLVKEVVYQVDKAFADVALSANVATLTAEPDVMELIDLLGTNPVSSFIMPVHQMLNMAEFQPFKTDAGMALAFATSLNCEDHVVSSGFDSLPAGTTIPGQESFAEKLEKFGSTTLPAGSCVPDFTCTSDASSSEQEVCNAANTYLGKVRGLKSPANAIYRCDIFTHPNSDTICDPKDLSQRADGSWSNSCVSTVCEAGQACTSTVSRRPVLCNLDVFTAYVKAYKERIHNTLARVDTVVPQVEAKIQVELRGWVDSSFIEPMKVIVDGGSCGFLNLAYRGMVQGLCYQGAWGLRAIGNAYVTMAAMSLIITVLAYAIWRRAIDNANSWVAMQAAEA